MKKQLESGKKPCKTYIIEKIESKKLSPEEIDLFFTPINGKRGSKVETLTEDEINGLLTAVDDSH